MLTTADPLYSGVIGAHDAFIVFAVLFQKENTGDAIKDACERWLNDA